MDLWYLPNNLLKYTEYQYVIDIVGHFSKWNGYIKLKKNGYEELQFFKKFIYSFGKCNTLHANNRLEFKNNLIDNFFAAKEIIHIYSKPYTPN